MDTLLGIISILVIFVFAALTGAAAMGIVVGAVALYATLLCVAIVFYVWAWLQEQSKLMWLLLKDKFLTIWPR